MRLYQTLTFTIHGKLVRKSTSKIIYLKYQLRHGMESLNNVIDHILYRIFKITLNISKKDMRQLQIISQ